MILATNHLTTLAGGGVTNLDGIGSNAKFQSPKGLVPTFDGSALYVADSGTGRIRKVVDP